MYNQAMRSLLILAILLGGCATGEPVSGQRDARKGKSDQRFDWLSPWLDGGTPYPDLPPRLPDAAPADLLAKDLHKLPDKALLPDQGVSCPDGYEPNNLCSSATGAGSVTENAGFSSPKYGTIDNAGDVDWFSATGKEASGTCIPFTSECFQFKVQVSVPAGRTFKVCLYKDNCNGASTCVSNLAGQTTLTTQFKVDGTCAFTDDVDARIMIQPTDGKGSCDNYSMIFRYDSC